MTELLAILTDPAIPFFRYALLAGLLSSIAFGIIGSYVVARRISYLAGAISHCILGGIGGALYLQKAKGVEWLDPVWGAALAALVAAVVIGLVSLHARQREDTVIGALWGIGMAAGLLFLAKTPGYVEPMSYLFGNILLMTRNDVLVVLVLDLIIVAAGLLFYNRFLAVCFDGEFARLRGVPTRLYYMLLLVLTSLAIVLLVRLVGVVLVVALLTLPAAVASYFCRSLWQMMLLSSLCCALFIVGGLLSSYQLDLPSGPTIIIIAGGVYLLVAAGQSLRRRWLR
ncbi:MAG: metal ABC transporter permease [Thermodesulfobacteriota bacterium]